MKNKQIINQKSTIGNHKFLIVHHPSSACLGVAEGEARVVCRLESVVCGLSSSVRCRLKHEFFNSYKNSLTGLINSLKYKFSYS
jgi:hypothetical protein